MTERPILMSAPMVCAILEGRKTQTRRVVDIRKFGGPSETHASRGQFRNVDGLWQSSAGRFNTWSEPRACPYGQPGDCLWVKETHQHTTDFRGTGVIVYAADHSARFLLAEEGGEGDLCGIAGKADASRCLPVDRWRPSIHMPRWASRITLEVVSVRVERVQDISEGDAVAESFVSRDDFFRTFYDLNKRAPRDQNPWVWVVEFKRIGGGK